MADKIHRYEVSGYGEFPLDMLRYDGAWPSTEHDTSTILDVAQRRSVQIEGTRPPTIGRWESFLWKVRLLS